MKPETMMIRDVESEASYALGVGLYEKTPPAERLVGIAYTTWHSPVFTTWGKSTWSQPQDGAYWSDDRAVIRRHAVQLRDAGIDFIFIDWTNNTGYDPGTMKESCLDMRMIEEATDALFEEWSQIPGAPKVCIFAGPGHSGPEHVANGNHQRKVDQIWRSYVEKYPELYFRYEGKPLLICYGATPNLYGTEPTWNDERFTVRFVTGYVGQQPDLYDPQTLRSYGFWSWEERGAQTYTVQDGRVECITCTAASREQVASGDLAYIPAIPRRDGQTLRRQFARARALGARIVTLISWNEWAKGEQISVEGSKDLEPSEAHGGFYYEVLCEEIARFKGEE